MLDSHMQEKLIKALNSVGQCIFVIDAKNNIIWANKETQKLFGNDIFEKKCYQVFNCCKGRCSECLFRSKKRTPRAKCREISIKTKQGEKKTFLCHSRFFDSPKDMNPQLKVNFLTDITQQKIIEKALREDEEKFRLLSDQSLIGVFIIKDDALVYINKAAVQMTGYTADEIKKWSLRDFSRIIYKEDVSFVMDQYRKKMKGDKKIVTNYQWRGVSKSGEVVWLDFYSHPIHYQGGNAIFAMFLDITGQKKIEKELHDRAKRIQAQQSVIVKLANNLSKYKGNFSEYNKLVAERASAVVNVDRVSIWMFQNDKKELHCRELFQRNIHKHSQGQVLYSEKYPCYFKNIKENRAINVSDALEDAQTKEFTGRYLKPFGITSMLDAGIRKSGELVGIVCFEHVGKKRTWQDDEVMFASEIADHISQVIIADERIKAENALRISEKKYRELYEHSLDGIITCDIYGRIMDCNLSFEKMLGYTIDELKELTYFDLTPKKWFEMESKIVKEKIFVAGYSGIYEKEYIRKDGTVFPVELSSYLISGDKGKPAGMWSIARDITVRKKSESLIKASEEKYRILTENLPQKIFYKDLNSVYVSCNLNYAHDLGIDPDMIVGKTDYDFYAKETAKRYIASDKKVIASGEIERMEEEYDQDGEKRYFLIMKSPVRDSQGKMTGILGVTWDITNQKKTQEIIVQTEKMISLGGLAAGMAHEINNPLAGILQNLQVIRNRMMVPLEKNIQVSEECGVSFEKIKEYMEARGCNEIIERILESGQRASKIIENMLNFSRKGEQNFSMQEIESIMDNTVELAFNDFDLKRKYDFRQIKIVREYQEHIPKVLCDPTQMQQVFFNLLKNGAESMAEKLQKKKYRPRFIFRIKHVANFVKIEIEDNGMGMAAEVRRRIFEPFYTTKKIGFGTGLGLSVAYFIITENHKGTITVESSALRGSKFIISLPVNEEG